MTPELSPMPGASVLKVLGMLLICLGALWIIGGAISSRGLGSRGSTQQNASSAPLTPTLTLADAQKAIPGILRNIYEALDKGNPQIVGEYLHSGILKDSQKLDYLCQPFSYRAHYVDSIVERPNKWFVVRIRTLFKPLREKAYIMYFGIWNGHFYLHQGEDDRLASEREAAVHAARQFVFAAKAEQWGVLRQFSSQRLDLTPLLEGRWKDVLDPIRQPSVEDVQLVSESGLKFRVRVSYEHSLFNTVLMIVEPSGDPKVVSVIYDNPAAHERRITDTDLENDTLSRFGLKRE